MYSSRILSQKQLSFLLLEASCFCTFKVVRWATSCHTVERGDPGIVTNVQQMSLPSHVNGRNAIDEGCLATSGLSEGYSVGPHKRMTRLRGGQCHTVRNSVLCDQTRYVARYDLAWHAETQQAHIVRLSVVTTDQKEGWMTHHFAKTASKKNTKNGTTIIVTTSATHT